MSSASLLSLRQRLYVLRLTISSHHLKGLSVPLINPLNRFLTAVLSFLALTQALNAQQPPPLATADSLGAEIFTHAQSTGMVLVVVRDNEVYIQTYGQTRIGSRQKPTPDSLIRLCSLSKILATDLLVKLAVDGTVHLDDPLQKFAPTGETVPTRTIHGPAERPITLGDLATHTAGLPREIAYPAADAAHFTFPDHAFRWQWLPGFRLRTSPGTAVHYSNIGFDLLGDALEQASGKPYSTLFAERTATPLGLHDTTLTPTAKQCARLLQGGKDEGPCTSTQAGAASGGMYSTANDMARFLQYLLRTGPPFQNTAAQAPYLLPSQLRSVQGVDHAGPALGIGLGWIYTGDPTLPPTAPSMIIEKTGGGAGFTTYIALNQAHHTAVFLAATEGRHSVHSNIFRETNDLLLTLAGLPPLPIEVAPEPVKSVRGAPRPGKRTALVSKAHPQSSSAKMKRNRSHKR